MKSRNRRNNKTVIRLKSEGVKNDTNKISWVNILKFIPLITGILISLGYLDMHLYYREFGISIASYLTTGELLLAFLDSSLVPVVLLIILMLWFGLYMAERIDIFNKYSDKVFSLLVNRRPVLVGFIIIVLSYAVLILVVMIWLSSIMFSSDLSLETRFFRLVLLVFSFVLLYIPLLLLSTKRLKNFIGIAVGIIVFITMLLPFYYELKAGTIAVGVQNTEVTIHFPERNVNSNFPLVFLGKTKEYIFLKNIISSKNIIYPMKGVTRLDIYSIDEDTDRAVTNIRELYSKKEAIKLKMSIIDSMVNYNPCDSMLLYRIDSLNIELRKQYNELDSLMLVPH